MRVIVAALVAAMMLFGGGPASANPASDLVAALMPLPTGDPTFDVPEADLGAMVPGDVIKVQDLGVTAGLKLFVPGASVSLVKVRSTDALGAPSWATGTLVIPPTPWLGPGARPILVNNLAINSLGRHCTIGYKLSHNDSLDSLVVSDLPPVTAPAAWLRGYAVLLPDHLGPNMAYGAGQESAHAILDVLRGVYKHFPELGQSRFAMTGYSGGAISTGWAAKVMRDYAPDLLGKYAGSAFGGIPADFGALRPTMDGTIGVGLYGAALIGQIRGGHPELAQLAQPWVQLIANLPGPIRFQEQCVELLASAGATLLQTSLFANVPDPYSTDIVRQFLDRTKMAGTALAGPLFMFNGVHDLWIPNHAVVELCNDQRARGVDVTCLEVGGEHITATLSGYWPAAEWLTRRLG